MYVAEATRKLQFVFFLPVYAGRAGDYDERVHLQEA
jgi:hypothetical protein